MRTNIIFFVVFLGVTLAGYGDPETSSVDQVPLGELPTPIEREFFTLFNFLRSSPKWWSESVFAGAILEDFDSVPPIHWDRRIAGAAKAHTQQMARHNEPGCTTTCCVSPNDCVTGEDPGGQMSYYGYYWNISAPAMCGGVVSAGDATPFDTIKSSICSPPSGSDECEQDDDLVPWRESSFDDRASVGGSGFTANGTAEYGTFWAIFFAMSEHEDQTPNPNPIASGSVVSAPLESGVQSFYMANWAGDDEPEQASVLIAGGNGTEATVINLKRIGEGQTYIEKLHSSECHEFAFMFLDDDDNVWRYPATGNLLAGTGCTAPLGWVPDSSSQSCSCDHGVCFQGNCVEATGAASLAVCLLLILCALVLVL